MAKNKKKNNNQKVQQPKVTHDKNEKPNVVLVNTINVPDEDVKKMVDEAIESADDYSSKKRKEADDYYESKLVEADALVSDAKDRISSDIENGIKDKIKVLEKEYAEKGKILEKEYTDKSKNLEEEYTEKQQELNESSNLLKAELEEKRKELDSQLDKQIKSLADLESKKESFRTELSLEFKDQFESIIKEKEKLLSKCEEFERILKKKEQELTSLKDDQEFFISELESLKQLKSEITSLNFQLEEWTKNYNQLESLYKEQIDKNAKLNAQLIQFGNDPQRAVNEVARLNEELIKAKDLLADCPQAEELSMLREKSKKFDELNSKYRAVAEEKAKIESDYQNIKITETEIENSRRLIKILEVQKSELERELDRIKGMYEKQTCKIFANLSEIDNYPVNSYPDIRISLRELCERFRGYMANVDSLDDQLYYDEDVIRTFVAGFASCRLMILEGLSGTGKSSLPRAFMRFINGDNDNIKALEVPVQSSWKDRNDLLGFYNDFKKQYKETEFLKAIYTATHNPDTIYLIVLDEMNLSRIEYYFADILSVLEKPNVKDWQIELISDFASISQSSDAWPKLIHDGKIQILDNTWFIGTANKDDSTFMITDKVYDRSVVIDFQSKGEKDNKTRYYSPINLSNEKFRSLLHDAVNKMPENEKNEFRSMIKYLDDTVIELFSITFGNRIANQLEKFVPVFVECGGTKEEAVDIMFSRKVLRKLEGKYDQDTKDSLSMLEEEIIKKYGKEKLPRTIAKIEDMIKKI